MPHEDQEEAARVVERFLEVQPEVRPTPCSECPWRRKSAPGWLGPNTAQEWMQSAHAEGPIACHTSVQQDDAWEEGTLQCAGAATYRANVGKLPRLPGVAVGPRNVETVFRNPAEFIEHHERRKPLKTKEEQAQ